MSEARITIFNNQDAILVETQATIVAAADAMATAIDDLPSEVKVHLVAVISQLSACSEAIAGLRSATTELNMATRRLARYGNTVGMSELERSELRLKAQRDGHFGCLSEYRPKE